MVRPNRVLCSDRPLIAPPTPTRHGQEPTSALAATTKRPKRSPMRKDCRRSADAGGRVEQYRSTTRQAIRRREREVAAAPHYLAASSSPGAKPQTPDFASAAAACLARRDVEVNAPIGRSELVRRQQTDWEDNDSGRPSRGSRGVQISCGCARSRQGWQGTLGADRSCGMFAWRVRQIRAWGVDPSIADTRVLTDPGCLGGMHRRSTIGKPRAVDVSTQGTGSHRGSEPNRAVSW